MRVVAAIREGVGKELPLRDFFEAPTVEALAQRLRASSEDAAPPPLVRTDVASGSMTSFFQDFILDWEKKRPRSETWSMGFAIDLRGPVDATLLEQALRLMTERQEALRQVFDINADGWAPRELAAPTRSRSRGVTRARSRMKSCAARLMNRRSSSFRSTVHLDPVHAVRASSRGALFDGELSPARARIRRGRRWSRPSSSSTIPRSMRGGRRSYRARRSLCRLREVGARLVCDRGGTRECRSGAEACLRSACGPLRRSSGRTARHTGEDSPGPFRSTFQRGRHSSRCVEPHRSRRSWGSARW